MLRALPRLVTLPLVAALCAVSTSVHARSLAEIRAAYLAIADDFPCGDVDGEPEWNRTTAMPATFKRVWPLVGEWAAAFLDRHPRASAAALVESYRQWAPTRSCPENEFGDWRWIRVAAVQLASGRDAAYAVEANQIFFGTFFVVARQKGGPFRVAWTVKDVARQGIEESEKVAWKQGIAGWEDGPLHGGITLLSRSAGGHPRFLVDADPLGIVIAGCTKSIQLSVWDWDGSQAAPLLMKSYAHSICDDEPGRASPEWHGDTLVVPVKGRLATMSPTGGDVHPRAVGKIRVTATGVADLGEEWEEPDLRFVDDVLDRVLRQRDTANVIDPSVADALYRRLSPRAHSLPDSSHIGMFGKFSVQQADAGRIATMGGGGSGDVSVDVTLVERDGHPFVTAASVRDLP